MSVRVTTKAQHAARTLLSRATGRSHLLTPPGALVVWLRGGAPAAVVAVRSVWRGSPDTFGWAVVIALCRCAGVADERRRWTRAAMQA